MAKLVGSSLPPEVTAMFDGESLGEKVGLGFLLVTRDRDGSPRPCMLSVGEILATSPDELRLGLWPGSTTAQNLGWDGGLLLCYVAPGTVLYVRGSCRPLESPSGTDLECYSVRVESVSTDAHDGMPVTTGITFSVDDPETVVPTWERQLDVLRRARPRLVERGLSF